jgi:hypothetical protein
MTVRTGSRRSRVPRNCLPEGEVEHRMVVRKIAGKCREKHASLVIETLIPTCTSFAYDSINSASSANSNVVMRLNLQKRPYHLKVVSGYYRHAQPTVVKSGSKVNKNADQEKDLGRAHPHVRLA